MPFYSVPFSPGHRNLPDTSLRWAGNTTDEVTHGSAASLDDVTSVTSLFWLRPTNLSTWATIISEKTDPNYVTAIREFFISDSGGAGGTYFQIEFLRAGGSAIARSTDTLSNNIWYFIGYSWDGSAAPKLYLGTQTAVVSEPGYAAATTAGSGAYSSDATFDYKIGKHPISTEKGFQGEIAWHGVWSRVLSLEEIRGQQAGISIASSCILFVKYGANGTGSQTDDSGNSNNGTITGVTLGSGTPSPLVRQAAFVRRTHR